MDRACVYCVWRACYIFSEASLHIADDDTHSSQRVQCTAKRVNPVVGDPGADQCERVALSLAGVAKFQHRASLVSRDDDCVKAKAITIVLNLGKPLRHGNSAAYDDLDGHDEL